VLDTRQWTYKLKHTPLHHHTHTYTHTHKMDGMVEQSTCGRPPILIPPGSQHKHIHTNACTQVRMYTRSTSLSLSLSHPSTHPPTPIHTHTHTYPNTRAHVHNPTPTPTHLALDSRASVASHTWRIVWSAQLRSMANTCGHQSFMATCYHAMKDRPSDDTNGPRAVGNASVGMLPRGVWMRPQVWPAPGPPSSPLM